MIIKNNQTRGELKRLFIIFLSVSVFTIFWSFNKSKNEVVENVYEYGKASFYGHPFIGRKTANGEIFTEYEYTCAHRTLPFGTKLKVTNLANNQSIIVRVNDRGPYVRNRIIDLSLQGAKDLGLMQTGVGNVTIEVVHSGFSSLGNTNAMEKVAVDNSYAYIDLADDAMADRLFAYLRETNQLDIIEANRASKDKRDSIESNKDLSFSYKP